MLDSEIKQNDILKIASVEAIQQAARIYHFGAEWVNCLSEFTGRKFTVKSAIPVFSPDIGKEIVCYDSREGFEYIYDPVNNNMHAIAIPAAALTPMYALHDRCRRTGSIKEIKQLFCVD